MLIQNKCAFSSHNKRMRKEEGATVAATPTFSQYSGLLRAVFQAGPAAFFHGVIQNIGKTPLTT
jgi:hypothetical protein